MRCKFYVVSVTHNCTGYSTVNLSPVYSQDPNHENKKFWDATPSGSFTMSVKRELADQLELGQEYYIDITKA